MRKERSTQLVYLAKVLAGLLSVASVCFVAISLPRFGFSDDLTRILLGLCVLFFIGVFLVTYRVYSKMDELQKKLHEHASVFAVTSFVSISGIVGALQANHVLPLFNQFITLAATIAVWGTALSLADRFYK